MQLGYIAFGFVPVCVSVANRAGWNTGSVVVARFTITCLCVILAALATRQSLRTANIKLLFLRGFLGGAAVLGYFGAVQETGAGIGTLLNNTHALWASVLAVLVLHEKPFRGFGVILLIAMIGIWLVINPSVERFGWGEMVGLLSGALAGAAILCVKELRKTDSALTILFSFAVAGLICGLPLAIHDWLRAPVVASNALNGWLALVGVGVLSFVAQFLYTQGYKDTSVQVGSVLSLTTPVIASWMGWFFLDEPLGPRYIAGASLTLGACTLMGVLKNLQPDSV